MRCRADTVFQFDARARGTEKGVFSVHTKETGQSIAILRAMYAYATQLGYPA